MHCHNDLGLAVANSPLPSCKAQGRSNVPLMVWASAPAMLRWKKLSWRCAPAGISFRWRLQIDTTQIVATRAWYRVSPDFLFSRTRPSSVRMPLHTSPASIRTVCWKYRETYEIMKAEGCGLEYQQDCTGQVVRASCVLLKVGRSRYSVRQQDIDERSLSCDLRNWRTRSVKFTTRMLAGTGFRNTGQGRWY